MRHRFAMSTTDTRTPTRDELYPTPCRAGLPVRRGTGTGRCTTIACIRWCPGGQLDRPAGRTRRHVHGVPCATDLRLAVGAGALRRARVGGQSVSAVRQWRAGVLWAAAVRRHALAVRNGGSRAATARRPQRHRRTGVELGRGTPGGAAQPPHGIPAAGQRRRGGAREHRPRLEAAARCGLCADRHHERDRRRLLRGGTRRFGRWRALSMGMGTRGLCGRRVARGVAAGERRTGGTACGVRRGRRQRDRRAHGAACGAGRRIRGGVRLAARGAVDPADGGDAAAPDTRAARNGDCIGRRVPARQRRSRDSGADDGLAAARSGPHDECVRGVGDERRRPQRGAPDLRRGADRREGTEGESGRDRWTNCARCSRRVSSRRWRAAPLPDAVLALVPLHPGGRDDGR